MINPFWMQALFLLALLCLSPGCTFKPAQSGIQLRKTSVCEVRKQGKVFVGTNIRVVAQYHFVTGQLEYLKDPSCRPGALDISEFAEEDRSVANFIEQREAHCLNTDSPDLCVVEASVDVVAVVTSSDQGKLGLKILAVNQFSWTDSSTRHSSTAGKDS